jgi:hypothetical protein
MCFWQLLYFILFLCWKFLPCFEWDVALWSPKWTFHCECSLLLWVFNLTGNKNWITSMVSWRQLANVFLHKGHLNSYLICLKNVLFQENFQCVKWPSDNNLCNSIWSNCQMVWCHMHPNHQRRGKLVVTHGPIIISGHYSGANSLSISQAICFFLYCKPKYSNHLKQCGHKRRHSVTLSWTN